jgi:hypothetical protein
MGNGREDYSENGDAWNFFTQPRGARSPLDVQGSDDALGREPQNYHRIQAADGSLVLASPRRPAS